MINSKHVGVSLTLPIVFTVLVFQGCSDTDFRGEGAAAGQEKVTGTPQETDAAGKEETSANERDAGVNNDKNDVDSSSLAAKVDHFDQARFLSDKVDIVFVVDSSGSMTQEIKYLIENLPAFIRRFTVDNKDLDYQLFVISGKRRNKFTIPRDVACQGRVEWIDKRGGVDSHEGLGAAKAFMEGLLPRTKPQYCPGSPVLHLRDGALKELVFITDDNAKIKRDEGFSIDQKTMESFLAQYNLGPVSVSGIIGLKTSRENKSCDIAAEGIAYKNLAENPKYRGVIMDLCSPNWNGLLQNFAQTVINNITLGFNLSAWPNDPDAIVVALDDRILDPASYTYSADDNSVRLVDESLITGVSQVKISYTYSKSN
jgi:hypothetical protein